MPELDELLHEAAHRLNEAFDSLKKKSEDGQPRSTKDPIFFSMKMIAFLGRIIERHQPKDGNCPCCGVPAPCPTIKDMLDHISGRAFQD